MSRRSLRPHRSIKIPLPPSWTKRSSAYYHLMTQHMTQTTAIPLITHDFEGNVLATWKKAVQASGQSYISITRSFSMPAAEKTTPVWATQVFEQVFFGRYGGQALKGGCIFLIDPDRDTFELTAQGPAGTVEALLEEVTKDLQEVGSTIEWIYNEKGESVVVPLSPCPYLPEAYPWLEVDIKAYADAFMKSDASILILTGLPGTGKTTFIKHLLHHTGSSAKVTYSPDLLNQDGFFAGFISDSTNNMLVMEDADTFLRSRQDGNKLMHRFLSMGDGLISSRHKKLVFTTNLPSLNDIDEALLRPGRCYDSLHFRRLTRAESLNLLRAVERDPAALPDGKDFTLAELFATPSLVTSKAGSTKVGFL
jgi:hypothetical protein